MENDMSKSGFWRYYLGTIAHPGRTFCELKDDAKAIKYGLLGMLIPGIGYTAKLCQ
jgi:hypothetical protein